MIIDAHCRVWPDHTAAGVLGPAAGGQYSPSVTTSTCGNSD
jgi:hypothetical protein